ncbi:MAG: hypothetical protein HKN26_02635 [Acidimicrobiales bacterium]|nr:hypothetical protein [Acidimicrobiales bacterium]
MTPEAFFTASRLLVVAGKGGVGKTTTAAAVARAAAQVGLTVDLIALEATPGLPTLFESGPLVYEPIELYAHRSGGSVRGRLVASDDALVEWLQDKGFARVAKRLRKSGALEVISSATPGVKDLLILAKIKQLEREGDADLLVVDAPAAGHAITFLQSPASLAETATAGPIRVQAEDVLAMLNDAARSRILLVALPEETPVNEMIETAFTLEDRVGVHLAPVVVNGLYPPLALDGDRPRVSGQLATDLDIAIELRRHRARNQAAQVERLARELPLPHLELPFLFTTEVGPRQIDELAQHLVKSIEQLPEANS